MDSPSTRFKEYPMKLVALACMATVCLFGIASAAADIGRKDLQVVARTLGFLHPKPAEPVQIAVVYAPQIESSREDAESMQAILNSGLAVGSGISVGVLNLVPVMVPVDQLNKLDGVKAVFVTSGLSSYFDTIFEATRARHLVSITTDMRCARAGRCVMAVRSVPKVEIIVNKSVADQVQVAFESAFRLMITEI